MSDLIIIESSAQLKQQIANHLEYSKKLSLIPLIAIIGPTASGKTALSIALARFFSGEIVCADSRQIYRQMDIGTAKATPAEQSAIPHHLLDLFNPDQTFSLSDYQHLAGQAIQEIHNRDKVPFLVGGTGLYINSLTQNYALPDSKPNLELRQQLENLAAQEGKEAVHQILQKLDAEAAAQIHSNNLRYVIRAIEIFQQTNQPKSPQTNPSPYHSLYLIIDWPREELYERINSRIDQQIAEGLIDETSTLLSQYSSTLPALSSLGYQEIGNYLAGGVTLDFALEKFKQHTRNYAKRQLTWFRKIKPLYSIAGGQLSQIISQF